MGKRDWEKSRGRFGVQHPGQDVNPGHLTPGPAILIHHSFVHSSPLETLPDNSPVPLRGLSPGSQEDLSMQEEELSMDVP